MKYKIGDIVKLKPDTLGSLSAEKKFGIGLEFMIIQMVTSHTIIVRSMGNGGVIACPTSVIEEEPIKDKNKHKHTQIFG